MSCFGLLTTTKINPDVSCDVALDNMMFESVYES